MNTPRIPKGLIRTALYVAIGAGIVNVLLALAGKVMSAPPDTFGPYMTSSILGLTVGGVIAAAVVYIAMRRLYDDRNKADRHFIWLSVVVLMLSFIPDIAMPWSTDPDQVGWTYGIIGNLMLMHVVAAAPVMYFFPRTDKGAEQANATS